jgi:hypothetical protein
MTRDNSRYVFIRPRDSGGGGPPVGRWRGRGRATNAAVVRRIACAVSSLPAMLKDLRSSSLALTLGDSAAPSTTLRVVPLPRFTGAEKKAFARRLFIRPRDSGGGGPPVGRWRGRGRAATSAADRINARAAASILKTPPSSVAALAPRDSAAPSTTLRVVPLPRFTGAEKEMLALCRPRSYPRKRRAENRNALAAPMRPSFAITTPIQEPKTARAKRRGERSAERRIQQCPPRKGAQSAGLRLRRMRATEFVACATPPRGARSPSGAPLRLSSGL